MLKPREIIEKIRTYEPPLEGRDNFIRLDFNENLCGCSPKVIKALKKVTTKEIATYPSYHKFKQKLAKYLGIKESELILTNGTDEAINIIIQTYVDENDEIILPIPTFTMFKIYATIRNANIIEIPYNDDLSFPLKRILNSITKNTKLIIIANPNNPTGTLITKEDIIKIINKASNSLIFIDEAYAHFSNQSCIPLINSYNNLVITQTFSKAFGLAGLRLGYIISSERNIQNMVKLTSPYSVNRIAIVAADAALDDIAYINRYIKEVKEAKKILEQGLRKYKLKFYSSSANFILINFGSKAPYIKDKLKEKGILVRDKSNEIKGCLRITIGTKREMRFFLKTLKSILHESPNL